jgi:phage FluMu protein Com
MLVAKFRCSECDALLKPAQPKEAGTKVKCPHCSEVTVVEVPTVEAADDEEPERGSRSSGFRDRTPARRRDADEEDRPSARDHEDEDRPARRSRRDEDEDRSARRSRRDEDEDDADDRRSRRSRRDDDDDDDRGSRRKSRKRAGSGSGKVLVIVLLIGGGLLVLGGLLIGGILLLGGGGDPLQQQIALLEDATAKFKNVTDQASADTARPGLIKIGERLREMDEKLKAQAEKNGDKMLQLGRRPNFGEAIQALDQMSKAVQQLKTIQENIEKLGTECCRVKKSVSGGPELVTAFVNAWGDGGGQVNFQMMACNRPVAFQPPVFQPPVVQPPVFPVSKLTKENFDAVKPGWTEQQVIDKVGPPGFRHAPDRFNPDTRWQYAFGIIHFQNGVVSKKWP